MTYRRFLDLNFLTDTAYEELAKVFETRFIRGGEDDCWPWMGGTAKHGRGDVHLDGQSVPAPRIAYLLYVGDIPEHDSHHGICVLHSCDNPPCVNPKHLFLGTQGDNMRDRTAKHRTLRGETRPNARLTEMQVLAIRVDPRRSRTIADAYGITQSMVCNVKSYKCWKHLPPQPTDVPVTLHRL